MDNLHAEDTDSRPTESYESQNKNAFETFRGRGRGKRSFDSYQIKEDAQGGQ